MTRNVTLLNYLPSYLQEFEEIAVTLNAEDPEFVLVWNAADQVLNNRFIATADEYGISRYESILGILPYAEDTLETRRARVSARWFSTLPYTYRMLLKMLEQICGDSDFAVSNNFKTGYTLTIVTNLDGFGQVEELERVLTEWLPATIVCDSANQVICEAEGPLLFTGGVAFCQSFLLTNDFTEFDAIGADANVAGGVVHCSMFTLTNDFVETYKTAASANAATGFVFAELIAI